MVTNIDLQKDDFSRNAEKKTVISLKTTEKNPVKVGDYVFYRELDEEENLTGRAAEYKIIEVQNELPGFRLKSKAKYAICSLLFIQNSM